MKPQSFEELIYTTIWRLGFLIFLNPHLLQKNFPTSEIYVTQIYVTPYKYNKLIIFSPKTQADSPNISSISPLAY